MNVKTSEKGQALILIVLAIVGLLGLTALAVDGGVAYSDRRQAQNTADAAALDAALAKVRGGDVTTIVNEGLARAASNGYNNDGTTNTVNVYNPPTSGPYTGNSAYVQVVVTTHVRTYFGPIVGIPSVTNEVQAVARVVPSTPGYLYPGFAVVGLQPSGCQSVYIAGNGQLQTWGGGIFSNSSDTCGLQFQGSSQTQTHEGSGGINTVASGYQIVGNPSIQTHGEPTNYNLPQLRYPPSVPNPICTGNGSISGTTMSPGNFSGSFPPDNKDYTLKAGIYCLSGYFTLRSNQKLTGTDVVIVLEVGAWMHWNGSSEVKLSAPTTGPFKGLLIFSRVGDPSTHPKMYINGNSNSELTGTIFLPTVELIINGNNTQLQKTDSQIIAYSVEFSGSSDTQIYMNAAHQFQMGSDPIIELVQ